MENDKEYALSIKKMIDVEVQNRIKLQDSYFNDEKFLFPDHKCEPKEDAYFDDVDMGA